MMILMGKVPCQFWILMFYTLNLQENPQVFMWKISARKQHISINETVEKANDYIQSFHYFGLYMSCQLTQEFSFLEPEAPPTFLVSTCPSN
jgi:hypothetical protein